MIEEQDRPIQTFLEMLRASGVAKYAGPVPGMLNSASVEFFPPAAPTAPGPVVPLDLGETPRCPCTHEREAEHAPNGLCYFGCPVTLCNPTATAKPESAPMSG